MRLDLKPLAQQPGGALPFAFQMDLSEVEWYGGKPFAQPVRVEGQVRNRAGALELKARLDTVLSLTCDRCAKPFQREKTVEHGTLLAFELANGESDDIVELDRDGGLELDELMREVFLLEMDTKNLCSQDCRGLCPGCGADLNVETCRCKREIDPRWAKLSQLLEPEETDQ
ncbi:MAG: DUF177 domain-containing protein [Oscillospiraceae bacterium]|nr:DUF177 domain-containing protein [Oscillospiraceae bacterium]MCI9548243.1 DUF177 domain-containing protein [Oscillospiraceae bacterium]